nr:MAG TPA: hypothetical protein [Caudoviricetes sp.]
MPNGEPLPAAWIYQGRKHVFDRNSDKGAS